MRCSFPLTTHDLALLIRPFFVKHCARPQVLHYTCLCMFSYLFPCSCAVPTFLLPISHYRRPCTFLFPIFQFMRCAYFFPLDDHTLAYSYASHMLSQAEIVWLRLFFCNRGCVQIAQISTRFTRHWETANKINAYTLLIVSVTRLSLAVP